ncbi:Outer membrane protein beta-barrel domain-containing protein [Bacteroidales bacterium KHT7]|nr:Outer membrane protein beta-barrel domain-containing protein [Bacteroidales bacterium KHT7]
MKKLLLSIALVLGMNSVAQAQTKKFEHNIYLSAGMVTEASHYGSTNGYSFRIGYGLNYYFSEKFSLMPCITLRQESETLSSPEVGGDPFSYGFVDVPVLAQFHLPAGKCKWVFGVGPMFSYCIGKDSYYIDAVPDHWLNGKEKLNDFSVGVQPSIMFEFWKMRIGVEGNIGLTNVRKKYDPSFENTYIHGIVGTVNFHF